MSGLRPQTPKLSSRPRTGPTPTHLNNPRSPPLTTSNNANAPYPFLSQSPSHYIAPKDAASASASGSVMRLKVKASTTPEAKSRSTMMKTPLGPRPRALVPATPSAVSGANASSSHMIRGGSQEWMTQPTGNHVLEDEDDEGIIGPSETVMVSVRVRPPNPVEMQRDGDSIWTTSPYEPQQIKLPGGAREGREWTYDRILPPESDNAKCYTTSARSHVRSAMDGYNAVIFAYGQTASGKTFTLTGSPSNPGIIPLAISDLFAQIRSTPDREFLLRASYLELYNETIIDLLSPEPGRELSLSEGKKKGEVVINGLTEMGVRTEDEVRRLLKMGEDRRKVGGTDWNTRSSRSHCVFRMVIESRSYSDAVVPEPRTPGGKVKADKMTRISTLSIIDLAGSEKHTTSKERNAEGKHINQSLLTLKIVISKLADMAIKKNNVTHVPYRDSKLTRLLQPSLSGDALISVICTISPSYLNQAESLSTLSFASGLKKVLLRAQRKELVDPQALIQQYQNEIAELRALLREKGIDGAPAAAGAGSGSGSGSGKESNQAMEKRLEELKSLILTSNNVSSDHSTAEARPLSPMKLRYPKLNYDKSTAELQEEVHAASLRLSEQEMEINRLKAELAVRPRDPNARVVELQDELEQYKLIAEDYERHLAEPTRKVREDVEKEYAPRIAKLESALESKTIWANRLDENFRAASAENKELQLRCKDAEDKIELIAEWINAVTNGSSAQAQGLGAVREEGEGDGYDVPETDDFSPSMATGSRFPTIGNGITQMDLANLNERVGTLTMRGKGLGLGLGKMLRDESRFDLAGDMF